MRTVIRNVQIGGLGLDEMSLAAVDEDGFLLHAATVAATPELWERMREHLASGKTSTRWDVVLEDLLAVDAKPAGTVEDEKPRVVYRTYRIHEDPMGLRYRAGKIEAMLDELPGADGIWCNGYNFGRIVGQLLADLVAKVGDYDYAPDVGDSGITDEERQALEFAALVLGGEVPR